MEGEATTHFAVSGGSKVDAEGFHSVGCSIFEDVGLVFIDVELLLEQLESLEIRRREGRVKSRARCAELTSRGRMRVEDVHQMVVTTESLNSRGLPRVISRACDN